MRSYVAVVGPEPDLKRVETMAAALRLPSSSQPQIERSTSAAFAAVSHRAEDSAPPVFREASTIVAGDVRLDGRAALERTLDVTTDDDLRLLFHAWRRWGERTAEHIIGDYSAVIWDEGARQLHCIRDRFGVRPLFYARVGVRFVVSDVLESVLAHPEVDAASLDPHSVAGYLAHGMTDDAAATIFAAIRRLPPRSVLTRHADGSITTREYWVPKPRRAVQDPVAELETALRVAIEDRTRGERAVVFMSGGLDSTALAALANEAHPGAVAAVTSVYRSRIPDEEESFATEAARSMGIPIDLFALDQYAALAVIGSGMWTADPGPLLYAPPTRAVYAASAAIAPLALHGHPADALFLGEPLQALRPLVRQGRIGALATALVAVTRARRRPPWFFFREMLGLSKKSAAANPTMPEWLVESFRSEVEQPPSQTATGADTSRGLRALLSPIWPNYFEWAHPLATRAPVELAYPFCDPRVVEVALALEEIPWRVEKYVLRELLRGRVSERVRGRRKGWLQGNPWQAPPDEALRLRIEAASSYVNQSRLAATIAADGVAGDATLRALVFEHWLRELPSRLRLLRTVLA